MLPASGIDLAVVLANVQPGFLLDGIFHPPETKYLVEVLLRTLHFLAGIVWIGHLYFFNLVNVNLMKALDDTTRVKVIPQLMPRALWWFRWGALITVLVGLMYYAMYILKADSNNAGKNVWVVLLVWLLIPVIFFAVEMAVVKKVDNGWMLAAIVAILMLIMALVI